MLKKAIVKNSKIPKKISYKESERGNLRVRALRGCIAPSVLDRRRRPGTGTASPSGHFWDRRSNLQPPFTSAVVKDHEGVRA